MSGDRRRKTDTLFQVVLVVFVALFPLAVNITGYDSAQIGRLTLLRLTTLCLLAIVSYQWLVDGRTGLRRTVFDRALPAYAGALAVAALFSIHRPTSFWGEALGWRYEGWLTVINYLGLFYLVGSRPIGKTGVARLIKTFLVSGLAASIYGLAQHFGYDFIPAGMYGEFETARSFSTFGNAFFFGSFLAFLFAAAAVSWVLKTENIPTWLSGSAAATALAAMIFSYTRSAWLASAIIWVSIPLFSPRRWKRWAAAGLVGALVMAAAVSLPGKSGYRALDRLVSIAQFDRQDVRSRLATWEVALDIAKDHPVLGVGPDAFGLAFPQYRPRDWVASAGGKLTNKAHNDLLQVAATAGFAGLLPYLWLLGILGKHGLIVIRDPRNVGSVGPPLMAGAGAYLIQIQFGFSEVSTAPWFWLAAGLLAASFPANFSLTSRGRLLPENLIKSAPFRLGVCVAVAALALGAVVASIKLMAADGHTRAGLDIERQNGAAAIYHYRQAAQLVENEEHLVRLAMARHELAKATENRFLWESAVTTYRRAVEINPLDTDTRRLLGQTLIYGGFKYSPRYHNLAVNELGRAKSLDPNSAPIRIQLGVALNQRGQIALAKTQWRRALELDPKNAEARYYLGR